MSDQHQREVAVFEAALQLPPKDEQDKPIRRRVALKIIKPGMDTRQVVARFEAVVSATSPLGAIASTSGTKAKSIGNTDNPPRTPSL